MPTVIYKSETHKEVAFLCDKSWELPEQLYELEKWVSVNGLNLPKGLYVADIGFDIRKDATGGGGTISVKFMKLLVKINMTVFFSEYPSSHAE